MKRSAFVVMALILVACGKPHEAAEGGPAPVIQEPFEYSDAEKAAIMASFPAPYNVADLADGEKQFGRCRSCHTLAPEGGSLVGPPLYGVFGRMSASVPDYTYSDAMKAHNTVWDFDSLDAYLAAPQTVVKGTKMGFAGMDDADKRRNLIAFLKLESTPRVAQESQSSNSQ